MARYLNPKNDLTFKRIFGEHPELCETGAFTPEELAAYDKYWDIIRTEIAVREGSRREGKEEGLAEGLEKGEAIGLEKGEAIGLEKGEAIGLEKGRKELEDEREKMVINSHKAGLQMETISTITGLTAEQIIEILKQNGMIQI